MDYTTNYNLKKPAYTDFSDVADLNDNMDIVDATLASKGRVDQVCGKSTRIVDLLPADVKIVYSRTEPTTPVEGMIWIVPVD